MGAARAFNCALPNRATILSSTHVACSGRNPASTNRLRNALVL